MTFAKTRVQVLCSSAEVHGNVHATERCEPHCLGHAVAEAGRVPAISAPSTELLGDPHRPACLEAEKIDVDVDIACGALEKHASATHSMWPCSAVPELLQGGCVSKQTAVETIRNALRPR